MCGKADLPWANHRGARFHFLLPLPSQQNLSMRSGSSSACPSALWLAVWLESVCPDCPSPGPLAGAMSSECVLTPRERGLYRNGHEMWEMNRLGVSVIHVSCDSTGPPRPWKSGDTPRPHEPMKTRVINLVSKTREVSVPSPAKVTEVSPMALPWLVSAEVGRTVTDTERAWYGVTWPPDCPAAPPLRVGVAGARGAHPTPVQRRVLQLCFSLPPAEEQSPHQGIGGRAAHQGSTAHS